MASIFSSLQFPSLAGGKAHIGIDVGASAIKIVALKNNQSTPRLQGVVHVETPPGAVIDGILYDTKAMVDTIRAALKKAGISFKNAPATIGIHGLNVVYKRLVLPNLPAEEMGQQVILEAQQQVDSDLNDWIIDYQVLGMPDSRGQVAVMLVAARKGPLEEYYSLLEKVGVTSLCFDCDVFALENSYEKANFIISKTTLFVDIGRDTTKINLIYQGTSLVARNIPIGGSHLTEQISKVLGTDIAQAEAIKLAASSGNSEFAEVNNAIDTHVNEIAEEIKRTVEFFLHETGDAGISIEQTILSGGGASVFGINDAIAQILQSEVTFANPFSSVIMSEKHARVVGAAPHLFSVAVGLALRYAGDKPT